MATRGRPKKNSTLRKPSSYKPNPEKKKNLYTVPDINKEVIDIEEQE